ncbi:MAG: LCP family protein [Chloroflexales bacterium]|nr:LCP family protein [Chloroflexales bacterium]
MNCTEACSLIEQGIAPGSQTPLQTKLGFHLAECTNCRAYREQTQSLLANLLLDSEPVNITPIPTQATPIQPQTASTQTRTALATQAGRFFWICSLILLVGIPLGFTGWGLRLWLRVEQNLAAMIVTPAPALPTTIPTPGATAGTPGSGPPLFVEAPPIQETSENGQEPLRPVTGTMTQANASSITAMTPTPWPTLRTTMPNQNLAAPTPAPPPAGEAATILLLGSDRRPGEPGIPRTDAIILVRVDPEQQRIALLSLPRDLWVEIPGYGSARINAAYVWGEQYGAPGGGMALARETTSHLLNIPIDYVAMIDFEGFIGLIDSIEGINVNVEKELYDNAFPTMDYGYTTVHFLPGVQHMDGITALTYSRIRHPDSDFVRLRRQQAVLAGIADRLHERGDWQNVVTADQITESLVGYVQTDMPRERILGLGWALRDFDLATIERYSLNESMVTFGVGNDRYAELPLPDALADLTRQFLALP